MSCTSFFCGLTIFSQMSRFFSNVTTNKNNQKKISDKAIKVV